MTGEDAGDTTPRLKSLRSSWREFTHGVDDRSDFTHGVVSPEGRVPALCVAGKETVTIATLEWSEDVCQGGQLPSKAKIAYLEKDLYRTYEIGP